MTSQAFGVAASIPFDNEVGVDASTVSDLYVWFDDEIQAIVDPMMPILTHSYGSVMTTTSNYGANAIKISAGLSKSFPRIISVMTDDI